MSKLNNEVKLIRKDPKLMRKINGFLSLRGISFAGGSIDNEGTFYITLNRTTTATYGRLGYDLKKVLGAQKLVLEGKVY